METLDWVEMETGEAGGDVCERDGHDFRQVTEARDVAGHPAAFQECRACGARRFVWIG